MKNVIKAVRRFVQKLVDFIPSRLPDGMQVFETWAKSIIDTYGFPDNDSVRFMLAAMVMHTGQLDAYKPKRFFALSGLAAASKEIAHGVMVELKEAQDAKAAAEKAASIVPSATSSS